MSTLYHSKITTSGLVYCLDAANTRCYPGSGTYCVDLTENRITGSLGVGVSFSAANRGMFSFNGVTSQAYIDLARPSPLTGLQVPVTICAMFYPTTLNTFNVIYGLYASTSGGRLVSMLRSDSTTLRYYTSNSVGNFQQITLFTIAANNWYFATVVVSGNVASPSLKTYLNTSTASPAIAALYATPDLSVSPHVGANSQKTECFTGYIPVIQIYNRALSDDEVYRNYQTMKRRYNI